MCVFDPAIVRPVAQLHSVLRRVDVDALESRNSLRLGNDLRSNQNRGDAVFASGLFQTLLPLGEARWESFSASRLCFYHTFPHSSRLPFIFELKTQIPVSCDLVLAVLSMVCDVNLSLFGWEMEARG